MAQELEDLDYTIIHELQGTKPNSGGTEQSGRRLLRIGIVTLGVMCIVQATLNISLRLAFYPKEDTDWFPFNSSVIADVCQIDQSQQNSTQFCFCCKNLLRRLLKEYQALETERRMLDNKVIQLTRDKAREDEDYGGSGTKEELFAPAINGYI